MKKRYYDLHWRAEMKMPGRAWLQFQFTPHGGGTLLRTTAIFEPLGLLGEIYWSALYPAHAFIFNGMHRAIANLAELGPGTLPPTIT